MATVVVAPASPVATKDACTITVADADIIDSGVPEEEPTYPPTPFTPQAEASLRYYLSIREGSDEKGRSYVFEPDSDGGHVFPSYVFPDAGTYVVHLCLDADDSSVANSGNVTVQ